VLTNTSHPELLEAELIRSVLHAVVKQSTEQIRRTRLLATDVFSSLLYWYSKSNNVIQFHYLTD
jgi:hypothetical protein